MKNRWNDDEAARFAEDPLQMRVYTSRLIGSDEDLVLHGGGNTSVKTTIENLFGEPEDVLYVKGSGWDLATIEAAGFATSITPTPTRSSPYPTPQMVNNESAICMATASCSSRMSCRVSCWPGKSRR